MRKTALNAVHRQMGAKMVEFNGWDMPVEYPASIGCGIINEHMAVRTRVGIFDVSHMGDIRLSGAGALAAVQHISMNDASRLAIQQAQYSALLYPQGTFVDDVIVHRLGEDDYLLVINAGTLPDLPLEAIAALAPQAVLVADTPDDPISAAAQEHLLAAGFSAVNVLQGWSSPPGADGSAARAAA